MVLFSQGHVIWHSPQKRRNLQVSDSQSVGLGIPLYPSLYREPTASLNRRMKSISLSLRL